jgi:hypothetical protein
MGDHCNCRSMPVIEYLGADHEDVHARAGHVRSLIAAGCRDDAVAPTDRDAVAPTDRDAVEAAAIAVIAAIAARADVG